MTATSLFKSTAPMQRAYHLPSIQRKKYCLVGHPGGARKVMILANDGGINLLRADISPYSQRIEQMIAKYPNVTLVACRNAVEKLQRKSIAVNLLPGAQVGQSAVDEIVSHLSKGWLYIKV